MTNENNVPLEESDQLENPEPIDPESNTSALRIRILRDHNNMQRLADIPNLILPKSMMDIFNQSDLRSKTLEFLTSHDEEIIKIGKGIPLHGIDILGQSLMPNSLLEMSNALRGLFDYSENLPQSIFNDIVIQEDWRECISDLGDTTKYSLALSKIVDEHIALISYCAISTQEIMLQGIQGNLETAFQPSVNFGETIRSELLELYLSNSRFYSSLTLDKSRLLNLPPFVSSAPAISSFNAANIMYTLNYEEGIPDLDERIEQLTMQSRDDEDEVRSLLAQLDNEHFVGMLDRAREELYKDKPESIRYSSTSYRELLKQVLEFLSPLNELRRFTNDPEDYHSDDCPMRSTRFKYVFRGVNSGDYVRFVKDDYKNYSRLVDIFHDGVHKHLQFPLEAQKQGIQRRAEHMLLILLKAPRNS